jgi:hypothetical protein
MAKTREHFILLCRDANELTIRSCPFGKICCFECALSGRCTEECEESKKRYEERRDKFTCPKVHRLVFATLENKEEEKDE